MSNNVEKYLESKYLQESNQMLSESKEVRNEIAQIQSDLDEIAKRVRRLKSGNTAFGANKNEINGYIKQVKNALDSASRAAGKAKSNKDLFGWFVQISENGMRVHLDEYDTSSYRNLKPRWQKGYGSKPEWLLGQGSGDIDKFKKSINDTLIEWEASKGEFAADTVKVEYTKAPLKKLLKQVNPIVTELTGSNVENSKY